MSWCAWMGIASDGREVSIVQHCRLLEMGVINEVIMSVEYGMVEPMED